MNARRYHSTPPPAVLLDREASILAFNRRVLAQARRDDVPLLERLRYVTIVSSNLDEFFEIRFSDLLGRSREANSGVTLGDLAHVADLARELIDEQYAVFNDWVMPALRHARIAMLTHDERNAKQREWVAQFFASQVQPLLVPIGLDPAHPFPQVANKSLNFIVQLEGKNAFRRENPIAIVRVPRSLPRVIRLPDHLNPGRQGFVMLSSVIRAHLSELFPGQKVSYFSQFRITRDSDLDVDEDDATNLRQALRSELTRRNYGEAIRLEVISTCPKPLSDVLQQQFELPDMAVYRVNGPVNLVRLNQLIDQARAPNLRFAPSPPAWPRALDRRNHSVMSQMAERDIMLHHPFESFEPVISLLREAVEDPAVLSIRQTVYRTDGDSELMRLLIEAARRGKEVLAVVELKARFDEEANINWAERLEDVGAQVVYGVVGLKTHAKMLMITRREVSARRGTTLRHYVHLSTGNYNASTARLYTDIGFFTTDPAIAADVEALFRHLASQSRMPSPKRLLVAPSSLHKAMLDHIRQVTRAARRSMPARIVAKFNALTDPELMAALVEASRAGAQIDLVVRGACMLAPGVQGLTDNIRIRSVVGRFLEHSRIFYFRWGAHSSSEALYLSSADWMSRNMLRRIELAWPVKDAALRQRIIDECLVPYLHDERGSWQLQADGSYSPLNPEGVSAQSALLALHANMSHAAS